MPSLESSSTLWRRFSKHSSQSSSHQATMVGDSGSTATDVALRCIQSVTHRVCFEPAPNAVCRWVFPSPLMCICFWAPGVMTVRGRPLATGKTEQPYR